VTVVQKNNLGETRYLTKGDNNPVDDRGLYPRGVFYLNEKQVIGKVAGMIPYAGYLTIVLNDYPMIKFLVLGGMMLSVIMSKDPNN
jgi:signal peptidase